MNPFAHAYNMGDSCRQVGQSSQEQRQVIQITKLEMIWLKRFGSQTTMRGTDAAASYRSCTSGLAIGLRGHELSGVRTACMRARLCSSRMSQQVCTMSTGRGSNCNQP